MNFFPRIVSGKIQAAVHNCIHGGISSAGVLDVEGALPCTNVYTIFLPMPGKKWVLEYCAHGSAAENPWQTNAGEAQVEAGLIPPAADQQFDFHRITIPDKNAGKLKVLRALIDKDGAIDKEHEFQGVLPGMDAAAGFAFTNWKFRPATRASAPIGVDVLVGIPARALERLSKQSSGVAGN